MQTLCASVTAGIGKAGAPDEDGSGKKSQAALGAKQERRRKAGLGAKEASLQEGVERDGAENESGEVERAACGRAGHCGGGEHEPEGTAREKGSEPAKRAIESYAQE